MTLRLKVAVLFLLVSHYAFSQTDSIAKRYQVAVFTPLYLDSLFDASQTYKLDKFLPKYVSPGLEFYEGVQLALDSLQKEKAALDVFVYDLKAQPLSVLVNSDDFNKIDLIIGNVNNMEMMVLANTAAR